MEFKFRFMEQIVGAFLVLTVVIFIAAVVLVGRGQDWFLEKVTYHLFLEEGYGLKPGSTVKMRNSEIGKISYMGMDEESRMISVQIEVLQKYSNLIREDSEASIKTEGLIGGAYIEISPGSEEYEQLQEGGFVKTLPKKTMDDYMKELEIEQKIKTATQIINDLAEISNRLKNPNEGILAALDNVNIITEKIRRGEGSIGKILVEDAMFEKFDRQLDHLDEILSSVKSATKDVSETTGRLPEIMKQIKDGVKQLQDMIAQMEKASRDVPIISSQAKEGVEQAVELVETIKENPIIRMGAPEKEKTLERPVEIRQREE